ncbi:MAG: T9SS type A sorting domain-containing protein [Bacteroidia bacterium]
MKFFVSISLFTCFFISHLLHGQTVSFWTGADANDPNNWFNANNWQPQGVPTIDTDVVIDSTALTDCEILGKMATCRNLTMYAKRLIIKHKEDSLLVSGNLHLISGWLDTEGDVMGGTIRLQGNWIHDKGDAQSFAVGNGWIIFEGNKAQAIISEISERFSRLVMQKTAKVLTLHTHVIIENGLKLEQGLIETTDSSLLIMKEGAQLLSEGLHQTGGNGLSYIKGPMIQKTNTTSTYMLPIGAGEIYAPIALKPFLAEPQSYTARYYAKGWGNYQVSPFDEAKIPRICTNEYWELNYEPSINNAAAQISLFWRGYTGLPTSGLRDELHIVHFGANNQWEQADDLPGIEDKGGNWGRISGDLYKMPKGVFTIGGSEKMFPPYFDEIMANVTDDFRIRLDWKMQTVPNPAYFQIECSIDALSFSVIATLDSFASGAYLFYYIDNFPVQGKNYYRVKQVDASGAYNYSATVSAEITFKGYFEFTSLYPNPVQDGTTLSLNYFAPHKGLLAIEVYDLAARRVSREKFQIPSGNQTYPFDVSNLPTGIYCLALKYLGEIQTVKFIKE